ncbi:polysaccharide deacetylase familiy protein [Alicyclobacillus hesperidum subsp. aegles]|uniref:polysaccharide deacetylase family protein n=1 Tax=Alicyclobacillus hesperidum TaxID=89784 RepID=UPI0002EB5EBA|nr:polysaccharide deacetylase family protein [Alicyclobacillus hesperidum]KRW92080.1 polysaccharide deacetylase [Alicyclobacillus tengchongensis]GLG00202.1 polysaccharide deacetylase familiy protein [Alicyclobacillus hesperidum subsp. aegles]
MIGWLIGLIVFCILVAYCGVPVLWTRVFHLSSRRYTNKPGKVALTFDDGPHPEYTPQLLDVLKSCGVRATFFVIVDHALKYPEIVERMKAEGHEVQVHGERHLFVPFLHPVLTYRQSIGASRILQQRFGVLANVYRPTWGACNLATLFFLPRHDMHMLLWSVMVGDWRRTEPGELVRRVSDKLSDRAVIVLHDSDWSYGAERGAPLQVIAAIPEIVQAVRERGCDFALASECV